MPPMTPPAMAPLLEPPPCFSLNGVADADVSAGPKPEVTDPPVGVEMEVDEGAADVVDDPLVSLAEIMAQRPLWHLYPRGQHSEPHVSSVAVRLVVWMAFEGCRVAFCWLMSQVMGLMNLQSWPSGQHITDVASPPAPLSSFRAVHVVLEGQQKELGKLLPHCESAESPPQTAASARRSRPVSTARARAEAAGTATDTMQMVESFFGPILG